MLSSLAVAALEGWATLLRVIGHVAKAFCSMLENAYDVYIGIPLRIEQAVRGARRARGLDARGRRRERARRGDRVVKRALLVLFARSPAWRCSDGVEYRQAVAVLVDVSGTYTDQQTEVARIVKREVLPELVPGDALLLVRIDSQSYEKENVETLVTLDARPSQGQRREAGAGQAHRRVRRERASRSEYTDIRGALMLAAEYLHEIAAGSRVILVFSDMNEDLPNGTTRELEPARVRRHRRRGRQREAPPGRQRRSAALPRAARELAGARARRTAPPAGARCWTRASSRCTWRSFANAPAATRSARAGS